MRPNRDFVRRPTSPRRWGDLPREEAVSAPGGISEIGVYNDLARVVDHTSPRGFLPWGNPTDSPFSPFVLTFLPDDIAVRAIFPLDPVPSGEANRFDVGGGATTSFVVLVQCETENLILCRYLQVVERVGKMAFADEVESLIEWCCLR